MTAPVQPAYRTLQEIEKRQEAIRSELARINAIPEDQSTAEDVDFQGTLIAEFDELVARAEPLRKRMNDLDRVMRARQQPGSGEPSVPPGPAGPTLVTRNHTDPFEDLERVRAHLVPRTELVGKAQDAIEQAVKRGRFMGSQDWDVEPKDMAETAARHASRDHTIAEHILLTGTAEYEEAFRAYLRDPMGEGRTRAMSLTSANGGYLLPYVLDPTIVLTNNASANPWRRIARGVTTTSNAWQGVNSAGVNAAWLAEATAATDNSPSVGQIQIYPEKAAAWVYGSYELLEDTNFGEQLPTLLADARDRLEEAAFVTGSGHGSQQPQGALTALGTGTGTNVSTSVTGTVAAVDVYSLVNNLGPRFRRSPACAWLANIAIINKIRALDTAGGSSFWANFGMDQPEQLLGKGIYESTTMSAATATGSQVALFGDMNQFIIVDRVGVSMLYEPLVKAASTANLPTGQAGWFMFWRTSSGVATTAAFKVLKW